MKVIPQYKVIGPYNDDRIICDYLCAIVACMEIEILNNMNSVFQLKDYRRFCILLLLLLLLSLKLSQQCKVGRE